ncbi:fusarubin cluster-polyketide synthase [Apiospora rasikravindrae]|uniref:Fusarubin cluster-polyketide synthase n=1 Tax=Apiospora rasikravindrae TaxID=990691 RepID=A0ABR1U8I4_9PEZI
MTDDIKLYLFGDQTFNVQPHLRGLLQGTDNPAVHEFLVKSYEVLRVKLHRLSDAAPDDVPRFTCLNDFVMWEKAESKLVPLDMAITCVYQLGLFIKQFSYSGSFSETSQALGLCTGALAAAAVNASQDILDLVSKGVIAVTAAFDVGLRVMSVGDRVAGHHDKKQSWSIAVSGTSASTALQEFNRDTAFPPTSKPYVSVYHHRGLTISGPPVSLLCSTKSVAPDRFHFKTLPVYGPYHAPHLFSDVDVEEIMGGILPRGREQCHHASDTDVKSDSSSFTGLLRSAIQHILLNPIRWDEIINHLQTWIESIEPRTFHVVPIATTDDHIVYNSLKRTSLRGLIPTEQAVVPEPSPNTHGGGSVSKLAIIGMSGRFPGATNTEAFWDLLHRGLDMAKPVPALHWDAATHVDPAGLRKNTSATPFGCWLDEPEVFDARFFNISPREAPQIDPAQRLALMTTYEAIEQAGLVPDATPSTRRDRVGVFYGVTSNDWMETNSAQNIDTYFIPGGNRAFIPGRINYYFKFSGPSYAVDTACSSSLAGIHLACNSLWRGDIDVAIAGGTNILTNPDFTAGLDRGHFLSRAGNCKTFDDEADGYCRGEGIGTVIIKRLDDALAENDPILGVILGAQTNHSAESESITRPHVGAQHAIFKRILHQGAVDPDTVSYVEMHGTGTQAGDAGEMSSVLETFAPYPPSRSSTRTDSGPLYLGSVKANIGHGEASSGISSLIKLLLMMQKNTIVPHIGIKNRINRRFPTNMEERKVKIASEPTTWERGSKPRRVFVNNFSAAGGNSALLLEDAPTRQGPVTDNSDKNDDRVHPIAISAKNGASLQGNLKSLIELVSGNPQIDMGALSYTTTARRIHHPHRVLLAASDSRELHSQLEAALRDNVGVTRPKGSPALVFTFTGQGAQYPGMGRELFNTFPVMRSEMRHLDKLGQNFGFPSMLPVIFSDQRDLDSFSTTVVQLANVGMQIALHKMWASWNVRPSSVVGHSLGMYAALNAAGVLSDADTVYLVGKRGELLEQHCTRDTHAMLVVKGSVDRIAETLQGYEYEVSCVNSPTETVLAGPEARVAAVRDRLREAGLHSTLMKLPYAFHSSQLDPMLPSLQKVANGVSFRNPKVPVLCAVDGKVVTEPDYFSAEYLVKHSRQPVLMLEALLSARTENLFGEQTVALEIGPHPVLSEIVRAVVGPHIVSVASSQRGRPMWQTLSSTLKQMYTRGVDIRWSAYQQAFPSSHRVLPLPAYSWDLKKYWIQYVHDWSLRKGEPPLTAPNGTRLESTTIHQVIEELSEGSRLVMVVEADIAREDLRPLVQGHEVDGVPLCTPSVYADIALTIGSYLLDRYRPDQKERQLDLSDMTISKALVLDSAASQQFLQAHVEVDWSRLGASVRFMSFDSKQKLQEHAKCDIRFKDKSLQGMLQQEAAATRQRMEALRAGVATGVTARFNRPMVYRAIRPLAKFHADYRAIDEVILDSGTLQASSRLTFSTVKRGGSFHTHPALIDSLTQSCGFAMNCNDDSDLDSVVYMNHGWGSFQMFEPISFDKEYTTYTRLEQGPDNLWYGDVTVFDGETVVAWFGKIAVRLKSHKALNTPRQGFANYTFRQIQGVPRRVLKVILSIESRNTSQKQQSAKKLQPLLNSPGLDKPAYTGALKGHRTSPDTPRLEKALRIIAEESGIAIADLTEATVFADVGIDSLLGLSISARFQDELDLDVSFDALFYEYPSVAALGNFLGSRVASVDRQSPIQPNPKQEALTGSTTPDGETTPCPTPDGDFKRALEIIAEESGLAIDELTDDTAFADAGVDSLLSLVITSRFRDELEREVGHETLLLECPTVGDLRNFLVGETNASLVRTQDLDEATKSAPSSNLAQGDSVSSENGKTCNLSQGQEGVAATLEARKRAVDEYVWKYTTGWAVQPPLGSSSSSSGASFPHDARKVVLVTGATGSLGGHLVYHLAQRPDVREVVCLNRENRLEPYARQYQAMRDKGIRFPDALKPKLLVLQTDVTRPRLGLPADTYEALAGRVTTIIHSAWPMSAKRDLAGFEPQFQILRHLLDLVAEAARRQPAGFRPTFQQVSSIGVVGHYGREQQEETIVVPEERVDMGAVLPNGYSEAKWGCERMLDATLHRHRDKFRAMAVRLGQIAGSKTSGYWSPMEHFGFLVKSSATLGALPDPGDAARCYWTPVNDVAASLADLALRNDQVGDSDVADYPIYHIDNPGGQSWRDINAVLSDALGVRHQIPFSEWVARVRATPRKDNPASTLLEFLDSNYLRMSCGGLILDVRKTLSHAPSLSTVGPVSDEVIKKYITVWKEIGFLRHD